MIHAVLFDWDGTLVDTKSAILASYRAATKKVLDRAYPSTPEEFSVLLPMRAQDVFPHLAGGKVDPAVLQQAYHEAYLVNSAAMSGAFPQTRATLDALRKLDCELGLVTSKARHRVDADMARFDLAGYFSVIISGDVSAERKPHPGPVRDALVALDIRADSAIFVGDGPQDVQAGRGAGLITVACTYGFHGRGECAAENPDHLIDSIGELPAIVQALMAGGR